MIFKKMLAPGLVLATGAGLFFGGLYVGAELREKTELERERAITTALNLQAEQTAKAIENIKVENKTFVKNFRTIEKNETIYRDCKHPVDSVGVFNKALAGAE